MKSLYRELSVTTVEKFSRIKLLICDVDGVFSDGRIYLGNNGEELKAFHTRDGFGVKAIVDLGIQVAVITGRKSKIVENRMSALNVAHIYQGVEDKNQAYQELLDKLQLSKEQVAYIGDDVPDLSVMKQVGLAIAVADAHPLVANSADYITQMHGGFGAVREVCDTLIQIQHDLTQMDGASI